MNRCIVGEDVRRGIFRSVHLLSFFRSFRTFQKAVEDDVSVAHVKAEWRIAVYDKNSLIATASFFLDPVRASYR